MFVGWSIDELIYEFAYSFILCEGEKMENQEDGRRDS